MNLPNLKLSIVLFFILFFLFPSLTLASEISITARVPDETNPTIPILILPPNNSTLSDSTPAFVFKKSTDPQSPIWYYQMFLDNELFLEEIAASQNPVETNEYYLTSTSDQISITLKQPLIDKTYTWSIRAVDIYSNTTDSATWIFTIDTTAPFITITKINGHNNLNLSTQDPNSIPDDLVLEVSEAQAVFQGYTESNSAVQIILTPYADGQLKPQQNIVLAGMADDNGFFSLVPNKSIPPRLYQVQVTASDPAGNTSILPNFKINFVRPLTPGPQFKIPIIDQIPEIEVLYSYPFATLSPTIKRLSAWIWIMAWAISTTIGHGLILCFLPKLLCLIIWPWARKKSHYQVFDSHSQKGVSLARIDLFSLNRQNNQLTIVKLSQQILSNKYGYFKIKARENEKDKEYRIGVKSLGYLFPCQNALNCNYVQQKLYVGQSFKIKEDLKLLIPIDKGPKYPLRKIILILAKLFLLIGLLVSIYNLLYQNSPIDWLNFISLLYLNIMVLV